MPGSLPGILEFFAAKCPSAYGGVSARHTAVSHCGVCLQKAVDGTCTAFSILVIWAFLGLVSPSFVSLNVSNSSDFACSGESPHSEQCRVFIAICAVCPVIRSADSYINLFHNCIDSVDLP